MDKDCGHGHIHQYCVFTARHYHIKIKLSPNSGAATSGAVGRQPLKFGVRVRHQKGHIEPRAFRDCVTWPRARSRKHRFARAAGPRDDFRAKRFRTGHGTILPTQFCPQSFCPHFAHTIIKKRANLACTSLLTNKISEDLEIFCGQNVWAK